MKKSILLLSATLGIVGVSIAQKGSFELGVGPSEALPLGDWGKAYALGAGGEIQATYGLTDHFNLFAQVGYNYMFGKEQTAMGVIYKNPGYSLLPLMAGVKYYFGDLHIGAGVGYGISIFEGETDGRFMYSPQVGYRVGDIDFSLHYAGFAKNDLQSMSSASANSMIGLKVFYNFISARDNRY